MQRRPRNYPATPRTADPATSDTLDTLANPTNASYRQHLSLILTVPPVASPLLTLHSHATTATPVQSNQVYLTRPAPREWVEFCGASDIRFSLGVTITAGTTSETELLPTIKLARLVKSAETLSERENDSPPARRQAATPVDPIHVQPILDYLHSPYLTGYWELRASWVTASPYATYILEALGTLRDLEADPEASTALPSSMARKLEDDKREELLKVTNRLSSINAAFRAIARLNAGAEFPQLTESDEWIKKLDLVDLKSKFADAWNVFESSIYFDGYTSAVAAKLFRIKSGLVSFLEVPRRDSTIHVVGTQRQDVAALADFYSHLGVIQSATISRVFAPDEELFRPYFTLVSGVISSVITDGQMAKVFSRALDYYEQEDFQHCISTLGLIAEDYLLRAYTTLLREEAPAGLTLGQTVDRLHKRIDDLYASPKSALRSPDEIYEQIKQINPAASIESLRPVLRELLGLLNDDRAFLVKRMDDLFRPTQRRTPFPVGVAENLNELLKWRNAASHKSRVPLGGHEADRTLYCLISLVTWWQAQIASINWTKAKREVLDSLLEAAKASAAR